MFWNLSCRFHYQWYMYVKKQPYTIILPPLSFLDFCLTWEDYLLIIDLLNSQHCLAVSPRLILGCLLNVLSQILTMRNFYFSDLKKNRFGKWLSLLSLWVTPRDAKLHNIITFIFYIQNRTHCKLRRSTKRLNSYHIVL